MTGPRRTAAGPQPARHPRALFVLGVPRSGTTLVGNYLGSTPDVLNLAEYGGFYVANSVAPAVISRIPGYHHDAYLTEVRDHARTFAERLARRAGCSWYLDHTPWNLEVAAALAGQPAGALFVLVLRHYSGAILSLRRFSWAGDSWEEVAQLWANLANQTVELPPDRLIAVGYDSLAQRPQPTLSALHTALEAHGFDPSRLDHRQLSVSHAAIVGEPRPVIGAANGSETAGLAPIRSLDAERWSGDIHSRIWPIVRDTHFDLLRRFPGIYCSPPLPGPLTVHDDRKGLMAYEPEAW